jgi:hypothetical protein
MSQAHDVRALLTQLHLETQPEAPPTTPPSENHHHTTKTFKQAWNYYRGQGDPALTESRQKVQTLTTQVQSLTTQVQSLTTDNIHLQSTIDKLVKNASFRQYIIGFRHITKFFQHLNVLDLPSEKFDMLLSYFGLSWVWTNQVKTQYKLSGFLSQSVQNQDYKGSCDQFTNFLTWNKNEILQEAKRLNMDNLLEPIESYSTLFNIS